MNGKRTVACALLTLTQVGGCAVLAPDPPAIVDAVDLRRYAGFWYEIANTSPPFQAGCTGTSAEYTLRSDGTIGVVNTCNDGSLDGPVRRIEGSARVADSATPAKLKVRFFLCFESDYWIVSLDPDYQWAVVSTPFRAPIWILSRTPQMGDALYDSIVTDLGARGFDVSRLVRTEQPTDPVP
jgi:apolipoprotein D and lipocalin family protein